MSLSLYDVSIPPFIRGLNNLSTILEKGRAHASPNEAELASARIFADMGNLCYQIQRVSDTAKMLAVRVAQVEKVVFEDVETTFPELQERIKKTIEFLEKVDRKDMEGRDQAEVTLVTKRGERKFIARDFVLYFAVPNFYFHVTTAYDIMRKEGVPLEKTDYIGAP